MRKVTAHLSVEAAASGKVPIHDFFGNKLADIYARAAADSNQVTAKCAEDLASLDRKTGDVITRLLESNRVALDCQGSWLKGLNLEAHQGHTWCKGVQAEEAAPADRPCGAVGG